jgi:transcriptional regulator with XRE-family HTH domain
MASLREARAKQLLTIRDLSRLASVAPSTIYLIETGRTVPRPRVIRAIATVLGVELNEIDEFQHAIEQMSRIRPTPRRRGAPKPSDETHQ